MTAGRVLRMGGGEAHLDRAVYVRDGETAALTAIEVEVLRYLADRPGRTVSRDDLLQDVWGWKRGLATRAVDNAVRRLRTKVERDPANPVHLVTAFGHGYCLELESGPPLAVGGEGFVGRGPEIEAVRQAVRTGGVVTLLGPGGVGKTRLARQLSVPLGQQLGGAAWVELAEAREANGILRELSAAIDAPLSGRDEASDRDLLGRVLAGRGEMLVVLDNAEHLVAVLGRLVAVWRQAAPHVRWLVTSRVPLGVPEEVAIDVPPLPADDAMALFRARAGALGISLSEEELPAAAELLDHLDRLPLAIELAASRLGLMNPSQMRDRLHRRFTFLRGGGAERSLDEVIAWSWDLLQPAEQDALAQASVFRGGFTLDAAEAVVELAADAPWIGDLVDALVRHSLLHRVPGAEPPRFRAYESVQVFAEARLAGRQEPVRRRHALHFAETALRTRLSKRGHMTLAVLGALFADRDNALAALEALPAADDKVAGLVFGIIPAVRERMPLPATLALVDRGLAAVPRDHDLHGELLAERGDLKARRGDLDGGRDDLAAALELLRERGHRGRVVALIGMLGNVETMLGRDARALLEEGVAQARQTPEPAALALCLGGLGLAAEYRGAFADAEAHYRAAIAVLRDYGDPQSLGTVQANLARMFLSVGRLSEASLQHEDALATLRAGGDRYREAVCLGNLAALLAAEGRTAEAEARGQEALVLHRRMGNRRGEGIVCCTLGEIAVDRGEWIAARRTLRAGLDCLGESVSRSVWGGSHGVLAAVEAELGHPEAAAAALEVAEKTLAPMPTHAANAALPIYRAWVAWRAAPSGGKAEARARADEAIRAASGVMMAQVAARWLRRALDA